MKSEDVKNLLGDLVGDVEEVDERRLSAFIESGMEREALLELKGAGIQHLTTITGIDVGREVEIIYHIECGDGTLLNLRSRVSKLEMSISTVTDIIPGAILYERELIEMFGLEVENHPDPRRLYLPDDWPDGEYPLLKGGLNYHSIVDQSITDVKKACKERDLDYELLLEAERDTHNRVTLKNWLEKKIEESEDK